MSNLEPAFLASCFFKIVLAFLYCCGEKRGKEKSYGRGVKIGIFRSRNGSGESLDGDRETPLRETYRCRRSSCACFGKVSVGVQGAFRSVKEMCQSPNIGAVYVATPHELHAQHTSAALENGKHVHGEKPMALSLDDCEAMNTTAEKHRVKLMAGHTHSFDPPIRTSK